MNLGSNECVADLKKDVVFFAGVLISFSHRFRPLSSVFLFPPLNTNSWDFIANQAATDYLTLQPGRTNVS